MKVNDVLDLDELESLEVEGGAKVKKSNLPQMPKTSSRSKFSSWNTADEQPTKQAEPPTSNFMDEVDELLLEQELLSPVSASQAIKKLGSNGKLDAMKNMTKEQLKNKISKDFGTEAPTFDDDEEFDLDNSDDLNRFINKYEQMLSSKSAEPAQVAKPVSKKRSDSQIDGDDIDSLVEEELSRKSDSELDEPMKVEISSKPGLVAETRRQSTPANITQPILQMGSHRSSVEDSLSTSGGGESKMFKELFTTANKTKGIAGIAFDQSEQSKNDPDVQEEKQLNKHRSKKDLKNKFQSSAAVNFDDKENKNGIDESEVEEIIKQHLAEEDLGKKKKKKVKKEEEEPQPEEEEPEDEKKPEEDEDSDGYDYMDDSLNMNVKTPKQTLIEHLRLLSDIFNSSLDGASDYYDQIFDERAQFMLDFDNILKIMTFDETVEYVLPCMQIYSSEQDYLKLKLFQNLEKLFKKLFKAEVFIPKEEIIDIITINIFPLASRMLMLSEEPVQVEGVESLLNLSKQYIPKEQAQNLMQKVIQVIMDRICNKSEHQETEDVKEKAKIAVLIIVQKFSEQDIFEKTQCEYFLQKHLSDIRDGMLFKIKKFLLPALIAISKHLDYKVFLEKVYQTFKDFNSDDIWGVRKVCIENLANLIKYLKVTEFEKLSQCIDFFKRCLYDANRWVKNQALIQFGPIVHQIYLKINDDLESNTKEELRGLIRKACMIFYDMKLIFPEKEEGDLEDSLMNKLDEYSFMQNKSDDVDKIKYYWAYNMPCAIMVNLPAFWKEHLKNIYELLYKDILINIRTTMSSGFKEVIQIVQMDQDDRQFFINVLNHYLKDSEEISAKVLPTICKLVSKFPETEKIDLLENLIKPKVDSIKSLKNGRDTMITMIEQLFEMFSPTVLMEANFHEYIFEIIQKERAVNYKIRAANVLGSKVVANLIKGKKYRAILTDFTDKLRLSKSFRDRQIYICVAKSTYQADNEIFKKHFAKNIATDLEFEKCETVKIMLAKLCNDVKDGYSKSLDKVRQKLIKDAEPTILQYMPNDVKQHEMERRYLALNYGDEKIIEKQMTEEEWLEKEKKEIEEVEKTVNIRFANYTTLMRAQSLTQGLSAQLAMFLTNMGGANGAGGKPSSDENFSLKLLEKAGIKIDKTENDGPKARDLSPNAEEKSDNANSASTAIKVEKSETEIQKKEWST